MGLPIAGGGGGGPSRPTTPPTHKAVPLQKLMKLALDLEDVADDGVLSVEAIEEFGEDNGGVPRATVYAAAATNPELRFAKEHDVAFVCCAGGCQEWGALDRLEHLLRLREQRVGAGKPAFDVHVRLCLDKCEHAPVVMAVTPDGIAAIPKADDAKLDDAVAQVLD